MKKQPVAITGTGIISPLGDDPKLAHATLCEGGHGFRDFEFEGREALGPVRAAQIEDFDATKWLGDVNLRPLERAGCLSISAALLALRSAGLSRGFCEESEVDLVLATAFGTIEAIASFDRVTQLNGPRHAKPLDFANTVINAAAGQTAIWHHLTGSNTTVCAGRASGLRALKQGGALVTSGKARTVLAGAVEGVNFYTHTGYAQSGQLCPPASEDRDPVPCGSDRRGAYLGEGSAYLVLEDLEGARARGGVPVAQVLGCGSNFDPVSDPAGQGAVDACARSIREALRVADLQVSDIDVICSSASGSPAGDRIELRALDQVLGDRLPERPIFFPACGLGDTLGASGMMQMVLLVESLQSGCVPGLRGIEDAYDPELPPAAARGACQLGDFTIGLTVSTDLDGNSAAAIVSRIGEAQEQ